MTIEDRLMRLVTIGDMPARAAFAHLESLGNPRYQKAPDPVKLAALESLLRSREEFYKPL